MFGTCGKMALLLQYLYSHSYGEYIRLYICILALIQVPIQVHSMKNGEAILKSLGLLHLKGFVSGMSKYKISSYAIIDGLIYLMHTM
jgi:hypothetical protein